jgi:hypothetical protein
MGVKRSIWQVVMQREDSTRVVEVRERDGREGQGGDYGAGKGRGGECRGP